MKRYLRLSIILIIGIASCTTQIKTDTNTDDVRPKLGAWLCTMDLAVDTLPFDLEFISLDHIIIKNAEEEIRVDDIVYRDDSIYIKLPVFDSEIKAALDSDESFSGFWYNYAKGKDYKIPVKASYGNFTRFESADVDQSIKTFKGEKWEVTFSPNSKKPYKAVGVFTQGDNGSIKGTFLTETGDYRYLEGNMTSSGFSMSAFDGSHAFLFNATKGSDDSLFGDFYSGVHWKEDWVAVKNPDFKLRDPYSLTYIKEGYDGLSFAFPDLDSNIVHYPDDALFKDKVVVIQIMGSWCPNCMDETKLLTELYDKYNGQGLNIVSLCFEKPKQFKKARNNIVRHKSYFHSDYMFLYAGSASKSCANDMLPMLNKIMSFPTSIFIDKHGNIRKIHTGFYGPGTGEYYEQTVSEFEGLIVSLLNE